jgi:hypothetical protein
VKHACPTALDGDVIPQETVRFGAVRVETHGFITHGERGNLRCSHRGSVSGGC